MRRALLVSAALTIPLALAAPSGAAVKSGLDRHAGVRLSLNGRVLTAKLVRPNSEEELFGNRIDAVCSSSFLHARRDRVVRTRLWPAGKPRMSFRFRRRLTSPARWCLLEHRAADVAFVSFLEPEPFRFVGKGRGPSGAWWRLGGGSDLIAAPCVLLRVERGSTRWCFEQFAERPVGLGWLQWAPCNSDEYFVGLVDAAAATVRVTLADGGHEDARVFDAPRGSRVRARFFAAVLPEGARARSARAYDAEGAVVPGRRTGSMEHLRCGEEVPVGP